MNRMHHALTAAAATTAICITTGSTFAVDVTFEIIPDAWSASDMTPDGRYIIGHMANDILYRWDTVTNTVLHLPAGGLGVKAISDDGSVILGDVPDPSGIGSNVAGIWTESDNEWTSLGALPKRAWLPESQRRLRALRGRNSRGRPLVGRLQRPWFPLDGSDRHG